MGKINELFSIFFLLIINMKAELNAEKVNNKEHFCLNALVVGRRKAFA